MAVPTRNTSLKPTAAATKKMEGRASKPRPKSMAKKPTLRELNRIMTEHHVAFVADAVRNTVALTGKTRF